MERRVKVTNTQKNIKWQLQLCTTFQSFSFLGKHEILHNQSISRNQEMITNVVIFWSHWLISRHYQNLQRLLDIRLIVYICNVVVRDIIILIIIHDFGGFLVLFNLMLTIHFSIIKMFMSSHMYIRIQMTFYDWSS